MNQQKQITTFSGRLAFILVSMGAAVGLANVWSFPFVTGQNGGGAFILVYLVALFVIATPIFVGELILGRLGRGSPLFSLRKLKAQSGSRMPWGIVAAVGMISAILVMSFYGVVAGRAVAWGYHTLIGDFAGQSSEQIAAFNAAFEASPGTMALWSAVFLALTAFIVSRDVNKGIEAASKWLMPGLFLLLVGMVIYAALYGDMARTASFLFGFRLGDISTGVVLEALGQAFFTLGIGVGGIMMLGSYMSDDVDLPRTTAVIALADVGIALLAGMAIFPLMFAGGVEPTAGPGLIFQVLPTIFADITGGNLIGAVFFLLLSFAALTSAIILMAPSVRLLEEWGIERSKGAWIACGLVFALGFMTIGSFNFASEFYPLGFVAMFDGLTMFDLIRMGINNVILPLGGLAFSLMVGWTLQRADVVAAMNGGSERFHMVWFAIIRYLAPVSIIAILLYSLFGGGH